MLLTSELSSLGIGRRTEDEAIASLSIAHLLIDTSTTNVEKNSTRIFLADEAVLIIIEDHRIDVVIWIWDKVWEPLLGLKNSASYGLSTLADAMTSFINEVLNPAVRLVLAVFTTTNAARTKVKVVALEASVVVSTATDDVTAITPMRYDTLDHRKADSKGLNKRRSSGDCRGYFLRGFFGRECLSDGGV